MLGGSWQPYSRASVEEWDRAVRRLQFGHRLPTITVDQRLDLISGARVEHVILVEVRRGHDSPNNSACTAEQCSKQRAQNDRRPHTMRVIAPGRATGNP